MRGRWFWVGGCESLVPELGHMFTVEKVREVFYISGVQVVGLTQTSWASAGLEQN